MPTSGTAGLVEVSVWVLVNGGRSEMKNIGSQVSNYAIVPPHHVDPNPGYLLDALYVTAGVGYGKNEFPSSDGDMWDTATDDRLLVRNSSGIWENKSVRIPSIARAGNSSGVCFADFNGDGWLDLFVGLCGNDYTGAQNRLLLRDPNSENFLDATTGNVPSVIDATVDVAAADLNGDTYPDLVVANRLPRSGPLGQRAIDYVLINNGNARFTRVVLAPGIHSDTRSVAVGDLDSAAGLEIVLGNAGSDGYSNVLTLLANSEDHKIQIFKDTNYPNLVYVDDADGFINPNTERYLTAPLTQQVLIADLWSDPGAVSPFAQDGLNDLVIVNHRDILKDATGNNTIPAKFTVEVQGPNPTPAAHRLIHHVEKPVRWIRTVALADFTAAYDPQEPAVEVPTLDFFCGTGNRFAGFDSFYWENLGWTSPGPTPFNDVLANVLSYDPMPGNERGYGFDFADYDRDGYMDAAQCARAYNFFVHGFGHLPQHVVWHFNLSGTSSPSQIDNRRGRIRPQGMEDGAFADFDRDGVMDLLLAGQVKNSDFYPGAPGVAGTPDTVVLHGTGLAATNAFEFSAQIVADSTGALTIMTDDRIDLFGRNHAKRARIGDRIVAGDLDNDGDVDAISHLSAIVDTNGKIPLITNLIGYAPWNRRSVFRRLAIPRERHHRA